MEVLFSRPGVLILALAAVRYGRRFARRHFDGLCPRGVKYYLGGWDVFEARMQGLQGPDD